MYRHSYSEVMEDDPQLARANERAVILHSIMLLERAEKAGPRSIETTEALFFLRRLWEFLLIELADQNNQLPEKVRADLISVGVGLLNEVEAIKMGKSSDFASLKAISQTIADGLK